MRNGRAVLWRAAGKARRGRIAAAALSDRGATPPGARQKTALRVADLWRCCCVARRSKIHKGYSPLFAPCSTAKSLATRSFLILIQALGLSRTPSGEALLYRFIRKCTLQGRLWCVCLSNCNAWIPARRDTQGLQLPNVTGRWPFHGVEATGSLIQNWLPFPISDCTPTPPPMRSAALATTANPMPVPLYSEEAARSKIRKIRC